MAKLASIFALAAVTAEAAPIWESWPLCKNWEAQFLTKRNAQGKPPDGFSYCNADVLTERWDPTAMDDHRIVHKMITIPSVEAKNMDDPNAPPITTYKEMQLGEIKAQDNMVNQLKALGEVPIYPIVIFGASQAGKSTTGNFLSCAIDCKNGGLFFLPLKDTSADKRAGTEGLWSSPILERDGKKFVILDMEGLQSSANKERNEIITKLLAMLSEVGSVFVYMSTMLETFSGTDLDLLERSYTALREHILKMTNHISQEEEKNEEVVKAVNKPKLVIMNRVHAYGATSKVPPWIRADGTYDPTSLTALGKTITDQWSAEDKKTMADNFDTFSGTTDPWTWIPMINMGTGFPHPEFDFTMASIDRDDSFHNCKLYSEMAVTCREDGAPAFPGRPFEYKLIIDTLADKIVKDAPLRAYKNTENPTKSDPLTAFRLAVYLEAGVAEMNKVGPLSETRFLKNTMADSCDAAVDNLMRRTLGVSIGALFKVKQLMLTVAMSEVGVPLSTATEDSVQKVLVDMQTTWETGLKNWAVVEADLFTKEPAYANVKVSCASSTAVLMASYVQTFNGYLLVIRELKAVVKSNRLEAEVLKLENEAWWEKNKWLVLIYVVLGILGCLVIAKICTVLKPVADFFSCCCGALMPKFSKEPAHHRDIELSGQRPLRSDPVENLVHATQTGMVAGGAKV